MENNTTAHSILSESVIKKVKELRITRLKNLRLMQHQVDEIWVRLTEDVNIQELSPHYPEHFLKAHTYDILEETYQKLALKISNDDPVDQEDIEFALKVSYVQPTELGEVNNLN